MGGGSFTPKHTDTNTSWGHEQIFFEDAEGGDIGFFAEDGTPIDNGIVRPDDPANTAIIPGLPGSPYTPVPGRFDDELLREAVANIAPLYDGSRYLLIGNNCQDFADAVRYEYRRLESKRDEQ